MLIEENIARINAEFDNLNCIMMEKQDEIESYGVVAKMSGGEKILLDAKKYTAEELVDYDPIADCFMKISACRYIPTCWNSNFCINPNNLDKTEIRVGDDKADFYAYFVDGSCERLVENYNKEYVDMLKSIMDSSSKEGGPVPDMVSLR